MMLIILLVYSLLGQGAKGFLHIDPANPAFDLQLYENVLDAELCAKHLSYIRRNLDLHFKFLDYGLRIPKAISKGNTINFGSYHECLSINEETEGNVIHGKYCMLEVPIKQLLQIPKAENSYLHEWLQIPQTNLSVLSPSDKDYEIIQHFENFLDIRRIVFDGRIKERNHGQDNDETDILSKIYFKMGMCLPKACTTQAALQTLYFNYTFFDLDYKEEYCRLSNDKPWTPADIVSITLLSLIGLVTILSTSYDIYYSVINNEGSKPNVYLRAFSIYTNTRRLVNYENVPGAIHCIDGIRAFAMAWVILGHTFHAVSTGGHVSNILDAAIWSGAASSLWITAAPVTVDTFFTLSGILVVYTTAGKFNSATFLKNLHLFYLNRLLRLFPILAFSVLLQISTFHRIADGPDWNAVAIHVNNCRANWWTNFLYVQNYFNHYSMCISHTWYLTVDTQLYLISPLVLFWVLSGKKKQAWMGVIGGLIISLTASTVYIFIMKFSLIYATDPEENLRYNRDYYINTLTRAPPFFVGMIYGYLLHLGRKKRIMLTKVQVAFLWILAIVIAGLVIYTYYYQPNFSGKSQTVDSMINAFTRPAWAVFIGWMILACAHGYGGILNWVLCLKELKLLSRVSYAMYIIHYPIMFVYVGAAVEPFRFDVLSWVYTFFSHFVATFICGFVMTLLVDSPASIFLKLLSAKGLKKSAPTDESPKNRVNEHNN